MYLFMDFMLCCCLSYGYMAILLTYFLLFSLFNAYIFRHVNPNIGIISSFLTFYVHMPLYKQTHHYFSSENKTAITSTAFLAGFYS